MQIPVYPQYCKWKFQFLASFEKLVTAIKICRLNVIYCAEIKLYAIWASEMHSKQFIKWKWGFICISSRLENDEFNRSNKLQWTHWCRWFHFMILHSVHASKCMFVVCGPAQFVAERVLLIRLKRIAIQCVVFTCVCTHKHKLSMHRVCCVFAIWRGV